MQKVIYLVRRQDHVSPEEFRQHYRDHAELVRSMPSVKHYRMNFTALGGDGEAPYDAIIEAWVDGAAFEAEMGGPEGQAVLEHGGTYVKMDEVGSLFVDEEEGW